MEKRSLFLIFLSLISFYATNAFPCTSVILAGPKKKTLPLWSFDWSRKEGVAFFNPKGRKKVSLHTVKKSNLAVWTSNHDSITVNQVAFGLPLAGMNRPGLVVMSLLLNDSIYPNELRGTPTTNELQWVQRILDKASTVEEAIEFAKEVEVAPVMVKLHYFVCDKTGACAVFEYLNGKLEIYTGSDLPFASLSNSPYRRGSEYHRQYGLDTQPSIHGEPPADWTSYLGSSLERFSRVSQFAHQYRSTEIDHHPIEYGFSVLNSVRLGPMTQWQLAFSPEDGEIHIKTSGGNQVIRFRDFDSSEGRVMMKNIHSSSDQQFHPFTDDENHQLILANDFPPDVKKLLLNYQELHFESGSD